MATPYEQPANVLSRVRYYDGEFLKDEDLIAEQQFHIDGKWRHDRLLHAPGIAEGLDVSLTQDAAGTVRLQVLAGTAVDSRGRTIILGANRLIDIRPEWSGELWVTIRFNEQEDRFAQEDSATGGVGGATRLTQSPIIDVVPDLDALRDLAPVALDLVQFVAGEQPKLYHKRTFAGLRLPGPGTGSTLQVRAQPGPPGRPFAPAYLDTPLEVRGPLRVTNDSGELQFEARTDGSLRVGSLTLMGTDKPQESSWAGIQFPRDPGGGSGDTAFIRYYVAESETCRLQVGIENDAQDTVALWQMGAERLTVYNGNVGIGVAEPQEKLEVAGNVQLKGSSLKNAGGFSIIQTDANDWLRINPDFQYPGIALHCPVGIGRGGLTVGGWSHQPDGRLVVTENALIDGNLGIGTRTPEAKLEVVGDVKINGRYLKNASGFSIIQTGANDWLRLNPDFQYPGIALYNTVGIGGGGLTVGDWIPNQPTGRLVVTENALIDGDLGIGTRTPGAKLEVVGDVKISGDRLRDASGRAIVDTKSTQYLRFNPDSEYRATVILGELIVSGSITQENVPLRNTYADINHNHTSLTSQDGRFSLEVKDDGNLSFTGSAIIQGDCRVSTMLFAGGASVEGDFETLGACYASGGVCEQGQWLRSKYAPFNHKHSGLAAAADSIKLELHEDGNIYAYRFNPDGSALALWSSAGIRQDIQNLKNSISDATLKRDVEPIHGAMEKLRQVRGVSFFWRDAERGTRRELGVLAQEVQPVLPELVSTTDEQYLGVRYDRFVPVLIQALKEQDERITRLEARLRGLGITP